MYEFPRFEIGDMKRANCQLLNTIPNNCFILPMNRWFVSSSGRIISCFSFYSHWFHWWNCRIFSGIPLGVVTLSSCCPISLPFHHWQVSVCQILFLWNGYVCVTAWDEFSSYCNTSHCIDILFPNLGDRDIPFCFPHMIMEQVLLVCMFHAVDEILIQRLHATCSIQSKYKTLMCFS